MVAPLIEEGDNRPGGADRRVPPRSHWTTGTVGELARVGHPYGQADLEASGTPSPGTGSPGRQVERGGGPGQWSALRQTPPQGEASRAVMGVDVLPPTRDGDYAVGEERIPPGHQRHQEMEVG